MRGGVEFQVVGWNFVLLCKNCTCQLLTQNAGEFRSTLIQNAREFRFRE